MRNLMRSEWLKGLLVLVLALMVAQCGTGEDITDLVDRGPSEPQCVNEDLTAGLYSFTIVDRVEGCGDLFNLLAEFGLIPSGPYTFTLPGYGNLPESIRDIVLRVDVTTQVPVDWPPYLDLPDSSNIPVNLAGTLCPLSENRVDAELAITLPQAVPPFTSGACTIEATLRGTRQ